MNSDTYALGLLGRLSEESPGETPRQRSFSRADTKPGNPEAASGSPMLISLHVQRSLRFQTRWPPCAFAGVIVRHSALCLRLRVTKRPLCPRTLHHSWCPGLPRELGVSSEGFPASFTCKAQQSSLLFPTNLQENQTFFFLGGRSVYPSRHSSQVSCHPGGFLHGGKEARHHWEPGSDVDNENAPLSLYVA